jgi:hypothetical protein
MGAFFIYRAFLFVTSWVPSTDPSILPRQVILSIKYQHNEQNCNSHPKQPVSAAFKEISGFKNLRNTGISNPNTLILEPCIRVYQTFTHPI